MILTFFPDRLERLVEPFAGSAALTLAAAFRKRARRFMINDAHEPLVRLWRAIVERPEELASEYERLWDRQVGIEREFFDAVRARFNESHDPAEFLYLLARCVKAAVRYNASGGFNNSPDNRRRGARPATVRGRILRASRLLRGRVEVRCLDYLDLLDQCVASDLIYLDPPYQGVSGGRDGRYAPRIDHEAFCQALASLNVRDCRFILSYDGRSGDKLYGRTLPAGLDLVPIEIHAGRSAQATLLGRNIETYEAIYLSPALVRSNAFAGLRRLEPPSMGSNA